MLTSSFWRELSASSTSRRADRTSGYRCSSVAVVNMSRGPLPLLPFFSPDGNEEDGADEERGEEEEDDEEEEETSPTLAAAARRAARPARLPL